MIWINNPCNTSVENIVKNLKNLISQPISYNKWKINPKCSIGIATHHHFSENSTANLMKAADIALYFSKNRGKNSFYIYDDVLDQQYNRQNKISSELVKAIQNSKIRPVFQPKISLRDGTFIGFEALARWKLANEEISPEEFITIAENAGLIYELDLLIIRKSILFIAEFNKNTGREISVSVNVSANSLHNDSLQEDLLDILWTSGLSPKLLTIEITESSAIENWHLVQKILKRLQKTGIRTALDDFGTGYSSLAYLLHMNLDEIKIDREFVKGIEPNNTKHKLLQHIAEIAELLNLSIVIEGIETEKQVELLLSEYPRIGQGYYFSQPLEMHDLLGYMSDYETALKQKLVS